MSLVHTPIREDGLSFLCPVCQDEDALVPFSSYDEDLPYCSRCGPKIRFDVLGIEQGSVKILIVDMSGLEEVEETDDSWV